MITELNDKRVAILGFGLEGISLCEYLLKHGVKATLLDQKEVEGLETEEKALFSRLEAEGARFYFGADYLTKLTEFDVVFRSPGIKVLTPAIQEAKAKGIRITSQTQFFFDHCPCKIIGVTGTKGKGTTSSLIAKMLEASGKDVYLGGNIGKPPIQFLDSLTPESMVVLELSSFQLQDITKSPHIAVVLMMTSEHLDYHESTQEYIDAKRNILRFQGYSDFAILNRDYPATHESDIHTLGTLSRVSREREVDEGCFVKDHQVVYRHEGKDEKIIAVSEIALRGAHNLENVCAAVNAASLVGVSKNHIVSVLTSFSGLEHRIELAGIVDGVLYYDDSFSTTPETAIAAIESFDEPKIIILGGSSKGADFTQLADTINGSTSIKAIVGIGPEWERIKALLHNESGRFQYIEGCQTMKEIMLEVHDSAEHGDVVLLSPGCASFGMFKNYKDRGEQFKQEVKRMAEFVIPEDNALL